MHFDNWVQLWKFLQIWPYLFNDFAPHNLHSLSDCFKFKGGKKPGSEICVASVLWSLWKSRNKLVFENFYMTVSQVLNLIKITSFNWSRIANMISISYSNLWWVSPLDAISMHIKRRLHRLMDSLQEKQAQTTPFRQHNGKKLLRKRNTQRWLFWPRLTIV